MTNKTAQIIDTTISITKIKPYEQNTRNHSDEQIDQIVASLNEFGWMNPILVDENFEILAGHGRYFAGLKRGDKEVPIRQRLGLSEAKKKAYRIADNKIALNSTWHSDFLRCEIEELKMLEFNLEILGFNEAELLDLTYVGPDNDVKELWEGMPEFDNDKEKNSLRNLVIQIKDQETLDIFEAFLKEKFDIELRDEHKTTIWLPKEEREPAVDKRYATDDESENGDESEEE